ncbi:hypothetical protein GPECTOR_19g206 [Gonium pectorale]|uniref:Uncharacterized protein n=1 Tax=Gonium pectorale TaxID=33097 RepID=A0A150GJ50_GONPE|nr:hypothetical protein GPECTOR_19g206 [Gonium pectorale]|eukprot:KXZ49755.1 hypothetical protein GPECTOR_19g206 [Gonium pectorale]
MNVPSLLENSLETVASNIHTYESLDCVPEELLLYLFQRVLELGKLNPRVLKLFTDTERDGVLRQIKALNVRDVPPIIKDTRNPWLGQKPSLY